MTEGTNQPFFELRQYEIKEGQLDRWVEFMDGTLIPFQRSRGMVIVGSWFVRETNQYVWIRRFESEENKVALYQAAYENDFWLKEARPMVETMLDRETGITVTRMEPTALSIIR